MGLWPSTRNLNSSPNYFLHSIFCTALLLSIVSPDNGFDLITDRDEFASHKVRPRIILCHAFTMDWVLPLRGKVGELWTVEKPSFRAGRLKIFVKISNCFCSYFNCHVPFSSLRLWVLSLWRRVYCSGGSFNIYCWINDLHTRKTYKYRRQK